jgi:hypothetical protein
MRNDAPSPPIPRTALPPEPPAMVKLAVQPPAGAAYVTPEPMAMFSPDPVGSKFAGDVVAVGVGEAERVRVRVAVTTGVMVATGVAAAENVCEGVTTTFVGVTDGVTTSEREFDHVAVGVTNCDAVTAGVAVLLGEAAAVPVTDVVTLGEKVVDGVTPAVSDDTAVTFVLDAEVVRVMVCVREVEIVRVLVRVGADERVLEAEAATVAVLVGVCRLEGDFEGVCVCVRDIVRVQVCVGVPVVVSELEIVAVADADAVEDGERDSVAVGVAVGVADAVGVLLGVTHAKLSVWLDADVSLSDATVALLVSSTRSVLLMARVSHVLAMPAAVHAAGGDQQPTFCGLRLRKTTDVSRVGEPRSTHQNSSAPDPPEWYIDSSEAILSTACAGELPGTGAQSCAQWRAWAGGCGEGMWWLTCRALSICPGSRGA